MNDREFIELLNLYVDREISAEDALRLETEVATDPGRRRIYDQYCRIQKACTLLSEDFPDTVAIHPEHNVIAFPGARTWHLGTVVAGMAAAAACALVRLSADQALRDQRGLFAAGDPSSQAAQLNWIGDIHMNPVFPAANADFLLNTKAELKAAVLSDTPASRDEKEPAEITAFRFQR
jgi:hypothetical protein